VDILGPAFLNARHDLVNRREDDAHEAHIEAQTARVHNCGCGDDAVRRNGCRWCDDLDDGTGRVPDPAWWRYHRGSQTRGEFVNDQRRQPDAGPVINCSVNLSQYVHYSAPSNDISWHWSWSCDGDATLTGSQALFYNNYPATSGGYSSGPGFSGGVNARYANCMAGWWQGIMSGTFTAPDYTPASVEGSSPANNVKC
jgi:hypothetical protein